MNIANTDTAASESRASTPPPIAHVLAAVGVSATVVTLILLAFTWPTHTAAPRDLPIAVVGPPAAVDQLRQHLPPPGDQFAFVSRATREDAIAAIHRRDVYGAVVFAPAPEVLTASAASPAVSQALTQLAAGIPTALPPRDPSTALPITDVVPLTVDDPRGVGLALLGMPLAIGGVIGGGVITVMLRDRRHRLLAAGLHAVVCGFSCTLILHTWCGFLAGAFVTNWAAVTLAISATTVLITGLQATLGRSGIVLGAVLTVLIANPIASTVMPPEFLPAPWGDIGQLFVPGATGTLLRSLSYFPDASTMTPWIVLICWVAAGWILMWVPINAGHTSKRAALAASV
ncbi:hypothetical protein KEM60_01260 [Austwickia sp. TVS 96-490-7B]|uniref:ABC transporter permease n=1 Tax=Austwickia sp. TVS 96-490-7B TaxID=2830843 RepID=UPI001C568174|nr:ABC transporter permease [Austwickia sp. TVS 96-490-7B]MBW3085068.1 hypothetical protein [Austwickia sp. TVS 96-490-7B]